MHYYQFNIGDYRKDTSHLIPIEHYIYRFLLDWYYLDEHPIPKETQQVLRRLNLGSEFGHNLSNVLSDFFELQDSGYVHKRVEEEIHAYHNRAHTSRTNGKLGGRPKKTQQVNFEKATNNQEPITKNNIVSTPTGLALLKDINQDVAKQYIKVRGKKPLTALALARLEAEATKAKMTLEQALIMCCENSWVGFNADWEAVKNVNKEGVKLEWK